MIRLLVSSHNPVLRQVARLVGAAERVETERVTADLTATLENLRLLGRPGVGLAAPQIGESLRMIYIDGEGMKSVLINPEIDSRTEQRVTDYEGCLSLPGITVPVERAHGIILSYQLEAGGLRYRNRYRGLLARILQHECDHLDGKLITDRAEISVVDR